MNNFNEGAFNCGMLGGGGGGGGVLNGLSSSGGREALAAAASLSGPAPQASAWPA